MAALKGAGWNSGKGKGRKGKGKKAKGKGWWNNGKPAGKSTAKSLNYWGSEDYYDAWGWDHYQDNNYPGYEDYDNYMGNLTMMLEEGGMEETDTDVDMI